MDLFVRPRFYEDVAEEVENLARRGGPEVAGRWHAALDQTIQDLLRQPHLGRERKDLKQAGIRSWRINHFQRWIIFYAVREPALIVLRVRYGMRDLPAFQFEI